MKKEIFERIGIAILNIAVMTAVLTGVNVLMHQSVSLPVNVAVAAVIEVAEFAIAFMIKRNNAVQE